MFAASKEEPDPASSLLGFLFQFPGTVAACSFLFSSALLLPRFSPESLLSLGPEPLEAALFCDSGSLLLKEATGRRDARSCRGVGVVESLAFIAARSRVEGDSEEVLAGACASRIVKLRLVPEEGLTQGVAPSSPSVLESQDMAGLLAGTRKQIWVPMAQLLEGEAVCTRGSSDLSWFQN